MCAVAQIEIRRCRVGTYGVDNERPNADNASDALNLRAGGQNQSCKPVEACSPNSGHGVPTPEELIDRQQRQRDQQEQDDGHQQRQREQQAAIVRSWGRTKEGEAARQKIRDEAHEHRLGWLKAGQVMQKFAWSSEKVQPRFLKLSTVSQSVMRSRPRRAMTCFAYS